MARVLICSDSPFINTGFSSVARSIGWTAHKAGHEVFHLGFSDPRPDGASNKWAGRTIPWPVFQTHKTVQDQFGQNTFPDVIAKSSPQVVIIVCDVWNVDHLLLSSPCPTILLLHIEGAPLPTKVLNSIGGARKEITVPQVLLHANNIITAGPFARKVIQDRLVQYSKFLRKSDKDIEAILRNTNTIIPDGIDTNVFKPIDRTGLKKKMFNVPDDSFVVGFFGRQNPRKGLPYAIQAFSRWKDRPDNAYLYLHTAIRDTFGWNVMQLTADYGVNEKVIIDPTIKVGGGCAEEALNMFYNACFAAGTPVRRQDGYRAIESIHPGDIVLSAKGNFKKVLARSERDYAGDVLEITTNRTTKGVMCTPEHPFQKLDGDGVLSFVAAESLSPGDIILTPHVRPGDGAIPELAMSECDAYDIQERLIDRKENCQINWDGICYTVTRKPGQVPYFIRDGVMYIASVVENVNRIKDAAMKVYNIEVEEDHTYVVAGMGVHNCDITLLPSTGEGAGLTALESSAAGTPAITTHYAEAPNYLGKDCEYIDASAFWIDPGTNIERAIPDVDQIVRKLRKTCSDRNYTRALGVRARKNIVDNFDMAKVAPKWLQVIDAAEKVKPKVSVVDDVPVTQKPKICFLGSYFLPDLLGGGEITYHKILKEFQARGWDPYCIISRDGMKEENVQVDGIWVTRIPKVGAEAKIRKYMRRMKPDAVITTIVDPDLTIKALQIAREEGATTVYYEQFYNCITRKYRDVMSSTEKDLAPWARGILSQCNLIYSNGAFVQNAMQTLLGFSSKILHPFIDFKDSKVEKWDPQCVTMINPDPGKGGDTFGYVVKAMPETKFLTVKVSAGCDYRAIDNVAKAAPNLEVMEFQKDVRKVYEKTKILLVPTVVDETFGRVIQEAQANGIPVIGRDVGGIKDTMGLGGILIGRYEDDDVWVDTVRKLLSDKDLYDRLSKLAIENAKKINYQAELQSMFEDIKKTRQVGSPVMKKSSICCVLPKNFHGVEAAVRNMESVMKGDVSIVEVTEWTRQSDIIDSITAIDPKIVVYGAWLPGYKPLTKAVRAAKPGVKQVVAWFSNFSQMEFTRNELPAFAEVRAMVKRGELDEVWMSSEEDALTLSKTDKSIKFYPCPYDLKLHRQHPYIMESGKIKVSLFCTPGPRKNLSNQIVACSSVPGLELHLNGLSQNPEFAKLVNELGIHTVDHGWMDKEEYRRVAASMDVGLQVTYAETFNYVALEHMLQGTPVVASRMVPVVSWDPSLSQLIVDRADSSSEIASKIIQAAASRATLSPIVRKSVLALIERNNNMIKDLVKV